MNYEIYTTKHWMILPSFVHGLLPTLMYNSNNHIVLGVIAKKQPYLVAVGSGEVIRDAQVTEDGAVIPRYNWDGTNLLAMMKEPFVNVIPIDGPITRNGDACSYGSKDIRDWLMEASDNKFCRAHVLVVNTPGGSAWAKNDFQQAIDFAHEKGQRVYMLIDGLCASAGMYLASFCDEVYVVNLKDQLGCVGVMASFFTLKSGDKNQFNNETYHEYYATKSINKNKEYRDIAEDDDATLLIEELDKLEDEFRKDMQAAFPNATDDHLDGKVFDASEVMGILCDGQMLLGDVIDRAFAVVNGEEEPIERTANRVIVAPDEDPDDEQDEDPMAAALKNLEAAAKKVAVVAEKNNVSPKNNTTMTNEKYQKIAQLLEVDELVVTEEGTFLNVPLLDKLEEKLDEMEKKAEMSAATQAPVAKAPATEEAPAAGGTDEGTQEGAGTEGAGTEGTGEGTQEGAGEGTGEGSGAEGEGAGEGAGSEGTGEGAGTEGTGEGAGEGTGSDGATIENAQAEIDKISETLHNAEQMIADKDKEIADKQETLDATAADLAKANDSLAAANEAIAERDKTIEENVKTIAAKDEEIQKLQKQVADLQAEVKEMAGKPGSMTNEQAGIPAGNGTGEAPKQKGSRIKRGMSYQEIREAMKDEK